MGSSRVSRRRAHLGLALAAVMLVLSFVPRGAVAQPAAPALALETPEPSGPSVAAPVAFAQATEGIDEPARDGASSPRLGAILATRAGFNVPEVGEPAPFAKIHLARVSLSGQAFGAHVRYLLSAELSGEPYLRDAELTFEWRPELQVRVGRFRAPFSREFLTPRPLLQLTDRSHVSDYFRVGRATGLSVEGRAFDGRLEYRAGVYDGASGGGPAGSVLPVARIVYAPLGASAYDETSARLAGAPRIAIGMNGSTTIATGGGTRAENGAARPERSAGGLDLALRVGRYGLLAEGFLDRRRYADGVEQFGAGAFAQAGAFVVPGALELAGRMGRLAEDVNTPASSSATRYELGATYYLLAASVKLQTVYVYTDAASGVRDMAFASGHSAQMQVLFVH